MRFKEKGFLSGAVFISLFMLFFAGCTDNGFINDAVPDNARLANPASVFCIEQYGELEIVDTLDGQVGYCILPDGSRCEEWAFYRGECPVDEEVEDSGSGEEAFLECTSNADCVPAECCHQSSCIHKDFAPDCSDVMCTMECAPGTLDCNQGTCMCIGGICEAVLY